MARIDYNLLATRVQAALKADPALSEAQVTIEDDINLDTGPWVAIYLTRRDAPAADQRIAAGRKLVYNVTLALWCWQYALESAARAIELRNDLLGKVEIALLKDRTLGGAAEFVTLEGGEMVTVKDNSRFVAGAELILVARVAATVE